MNKLFVMHVSRKIIFICFLLFALNPVSAQTTKFQFGVKGGLNLSTALVNDASAMKFNYGYHIGGTVDYLFTPKFGLQSGLFFSKQGSIIDNLNISGYVGGRPDFTHTFNQLYLQIPLYVAFIKNISSNLNMIIGFGPYFGYGIGGKTREKLNSGIYSDGSTETVWDTFGDGIFDESRDWLKGESLNPFDFGAGIKMDLEYKKIIFGIGIESSIISITNRENYRNENLDYRNINMRISTGYRF
jgi:hypothetical protein